MRRWLTDQRGDAPGWVLITAMTAGLVVLLWGLAAGEIQDMVEQAFNSVTGGPVGGAGG